MERRRRTGRGDRAGDEPDGAEQGGSLGRASGDGGAAHPRAQRPRAGASVPKGAAELQPRARWIGCDRVLVQPSPQPSRYPTEAGQRAQTAVRTVFDIVAPFPLLSQARLVGGERFGPEGGCLLGIIGADLTAKRRRRPRGDRAGSHPHTRPPRHRERAFTHAWGSRPHTRAARRAECAFVTQSSAHTERRKGA